VSRVALDGLKRTAEISSQRDWEIGGRGGDWGALPSDLSIPTPSLRPRNESSHSKIPSGEEERHPRWPFSILAKVDGSGPSFCLDRKIEEHDSRSPHLGRNLGGWLHLD
jgi:hypothetical protein